MYRNLADQGETRERRNQREARSHAVPRLEARAPNEVWAWDISKLATETPGVFLNLYLVIDLYSRYPVAWMIAERENSALAKQLFAEAVHARRAHAASSARQEPRLQRRSSGSALDAPPQRTADAAPKS